MYTRLGGDLMTDRRRTGFVYVFALIAAMLVPGAAYATLADPGPYAPGRTTVTVTRANGSTFTAVLHYPATAAGVDAPFDPAGAPYPAVSFGHGFLQSVSVYRSTLEHLSTHGYLVIASESESGLFPSHGNFATDISRCLTWLEDRNADPASFLFGRVDTDAFGLSGHSMGGGASILAAAQDPRVRALANLAAANTNPSAVNAMANVTIPSRLIAGDSDGITPVENHGVLMYNNATCPRQLPIIIGGFHCGFTDSAGLFCDSGGISRAEQLAITRRLLTEFFDLHLKGDQSLWGVVWGPGATQQPDTQMTLDARALITTDDAQIDAPIGGAATAHLVLETLSGGGGAYTLFVEPEAATAGWTVALSTDAIVVAVGEGAPFGLEIGAPAGALPGEGASWIVSARRDADAATRAWVRIAATATGAPACPGDANGDGVVDFNDLAAVLGDFGLSGPGLQGDVNADGVVNFDDLALVLSNFGQSC
ncbi:MAG: hypothetical protein EA379_01810 [Phycisphaerales bacterium]|nr:MAG: hypothetical protein EA379_01810 [Phycisphaerales bacterium]